MKLFKEAFEMPFHGTRNLIWLFPGIGLAACATTGPTTGTSPMPPNVVTPEPSLQGAPLWSGWPPLLLEARAGYGSGDNGIVEGKLSYTNLFGRRQTIALEGQASWLGHHAALSFHDPAFLDTPLTLDIAAFHGEIVYPSFRRTAPGGAITWGYAPARSWRLALGYQIEQVETATEGGLQIVSGLGTGTPNLGSLFSAGLNSVLRFGVNYDSRDDVVLPSRGILGAVSVDWSDRVLGADNVFARFEGFARFHRSILRFLTVGVGAQGGYASSPDHCGERDTTCTNGVPLFERFFLGGSGHVRGFLPRSLSPAALAPMRVDPNLLLTPFLIGGNAAVSASADLDFPLLQRIGIRGSLFFDAGSTWNTEDRYCSRGASSMPNPLDDPCRGFDPLHVRTSAGFGLRWVSPYSVLRLECGFPLSPRPGEDAAVVMA